MNSIETRGLTKRYGKNLAVDHLDLSVREGELFALLGVNGAGKTTTVKMLTTLTRPTEGDALVCGKSIVREAGEVKRHIAVSPQESAVAPGLTVRENLELMAGVHGLDRATAKGRVEEAMSAFSLGDQEKKKAGKLSGGWQRRLSLAMAWLSHPAVLFLDEPTLGLDVVARSELWDLIRSLKGRVTVVLTTHCMEEAEMLSDRVAVMKEGKLIFCGTPEEIKEKAGTERFEEAFLRLVKEERI